jgi:WD repeat-containing and planar cell polarity effector protein
MNRIDYRLNEPRKDTSSSDRYNQAKREYAEKRGLVWTPNNKHPGKLKTSLKSFEDELKSKKVVYCEWVDQKTFQLMLSNGLLIYVEINVFTGDVRRVNFDKYFVGKIISEYISDGKLEFQKPEKLTNIRNCF